MINGVLTLAQRSLRSIMTPRGEISWSTLSRVKMKFVVSCCRRRTASSRSAAESWMKSLVSCGRKRCWWPWSRGKNVAALASASPAIVVPETLDPINLLGVLRRARGSFVIVTNEFWRGAGAGHAAGRP
ncbi:magnesium and cobalt efflux protein CorC [Klebsiella pneumoniae]|uniref:Magnesium and cobalt efflux protein CorC n=1 Tax=Klebsiella pneumoniae TaxID=573 RepID=A0A377TV28_KLEPN|nr:magnesium and cobalt efflux protein CorC [Klebsiella pneumoniae]